MSLIVIAFNTFNDVLYQKDPASFANAIHTKKEVLSRAPVGL
jgi:hypothetical protein